MWGKGPRASVPGLSSPRLPTDMELRKCCRSSHVVLQWSGSKPWPSGTKAQDGFASVVNPVAVIRGATVPLFGQAPMTDTSTRRRWCSQEVVQALGRPIGLPRVNSVAWFWQHSFL